NIGTGKDISINDLALLIAGDSSRIAHIPHIHPQSEILKLICDYSKARRLLNWEPEVSLIEGIDKTKRWIKNQLKVKANV
ncbi:NAD-dependent dehydratase, partial [Candidatus Aerophobetes bacterium]